MDIDTSSLNASRRNLVLISIGFILFSLGSASLGIEGEKAKLVILAGTITFDNPKVLVIFSWVMFGWFWLRFWQFSDHVSDWKNYTLTMYKSKLMLSWYRKNKLKVMHSNDRNYGRAYQPVFSDWEWPSSNHNQTFIIKKGSVARKIIIFLYVAFKTELFGQYYFPYCLALTALVLTIA